MPIAGVVADANVLLSAAVGKAAARVFRDFHVEVHVTRFNCDEVEEYLPELARKYRLSSSLAALRWGLLGLQVHEEDDYAGQLGSAAVRMAARDPDDAHPLALAMALDLPVWSNDDDLLDAGVPRLTTAELLARLEAEDAGRRGPLA